MPDLFGQRVMNPLDGLQYLLGPAGLLALAALVIAVLVLRPFRGRHERQREADAAAAERRGMRYRPPGGNGGPGAVDEGAHRFSGETDGLAWTVETFLLAEEENSPAVRSYSRWTSSIEADVGGSRGYLLLINLPAGASRPAVKSGPFDVLLDKMAAMALFLYVRSYFGEERAGHLALDPRHRRTLGDDTLDRLYTVFADSPARLERIDAATSEWLRQQHGLKLAVLWDGAGLAVSCPGGRVRPDEVAQLATLAAGLVRLRRPSAPPVGPIAPGP